MRFVRRSVTSKQARPLAAVCRSIVQLIVRSFVWSIIRSFVRSFVRSFLGWSERVSE